MSPLLIAALAAVAGAVAGVLIFQKLRPNQVLDASEEIKQAKASASAEAKELVLAARAEAIKEKEQLKAEAEKQTAYLRDLEKRLHEREATIDRRVEELEKKEVLNEKQQKELDVLKQELRDIRTKQEESLERISKLKKDEAKAIVMQVAEKEARSELAERLAKVEQEYEEQAQGKARSILSTVIGRMAQEHTAEHVISSVAIPGDEVKGRIIGKEGRNIQAFEKATGVDLVIDETPDAVVISSFDPLRREVARLSLEKLIADGRIQPSRIEEIVQKTQEEVNKTIKKAGEEAKIEVKVRGLPHELVAVLGRLKLRTSYGQNQLKHAVEVSTLAGLLAVEIGANEQICRTAGLLHDLGKAVTHEVPGPHHHISMDIARKYGLDEKIIHAIGAHHDDIAAETLEAVVVKIADMISGARPGARRESLEQYIKRMTELENITNAFEGVTKSFAIQAGREIRVIVEPGKVDDLTAMKLAKEIATKIEADLQYPGQIKVTVMRETRAIEYAR